MTGRIKHFDTTPDGQPVERITLRGGGLTAQILTHGARVQDLRLDGADHPLVLGAETLTPYLNEMSYFGAIVGRFANRIADGEFTIDGTRYSVDRNLLGKHCLHGGSIGASERIWHVEEAHDDALTLSLLLADGEMGFPGALRVRACFAVPDDGVLQINISATTDAPTPCSFSHHGYFNLDGGADIAHHDLQIAAMDYLTVTDEMIPRDPAPVSGTRFDFRTPRAIGRTGVDHNFCLSTRSGILRPVAWLSGPQTGLKMRVDTDQPGLQVYDAGHLAHPGPTGLEGRIYGPRAGVALETQAWPDAPNRPDFPEAVLRPGETYRHAIRYVFHR